MLRFSCCSKEVHCGERRADNEDGFAHVNLDASKIDVDIFVTTQGDAVDISAKELCMHYDVTGYRFASQNIRYDAME